MLRDPLFRLAVLFGVLSSGVAFCYFSWMAIGRYHVRMDRVRAIYRFDPLSDEQLELAQEVLASRVPCDRPWVRTWTEGKTDVGLEFRASAEEFDSERRALMLERGDLRFLPTAEAEDVVALRSSLDAEREVLRRWLLAQARPIEKFNRLGREFGGPIPGLAWYPRRGRDEAVLEHGFEPVLLQPTAWTFTTSDLASVGLATDDFGFPAVQFDLVAGRRKEFGEFTEQLVGRQLAVVVSGELLTAPVVQDRLPGRGIINGGSEGFTIGEVKRLVRALRSGELPSVPTLVSLDQTPAGRSITWAFFAVGAAVMVLVAAALVALLVVSLRAPATKSS